MNDPGLKNDTVRALPETAGPRFTAGAVMTLLISGIVAAIACVLVVKIIFKSLMPFELLAGYGLALANSAVGLVINSAAMRKRREGFVAWGTAGNVLRAMTVLAIILAFRLSGMARFEPFVAAFLAGYFVFMIAEITRLSRLK